MEDRSVLVKHASAVRFDKIFGFKVRPEEKRLGIRITSFDPLLPFLTESSVFGDAVGFGNPLVVRPLPEHLLSDKIDRHEHGFFCSRRLADLTDNLLAFPIRNLTRRAFEHGEQSSDGRLDGLLGIQRTGIKSKDVIK